MTQRPALYSSVLAATILTAHHGCDELNALGPGVSAGVT